MIVGNEFIFKKATQIVKSYIMNGFWINPKSNSGSDGSEFSVDLRDGYKVINISVEREKADGFYNVLSINVYERTIDDDKYLFNYSNIWKSEMVLIKTIKFYEITFAKTPTFSTDLNEYKEIIEKQNNRYSSKKLATFRTINFEPKELVKIVNKYKGLKSIKANQINCLFRDVTSNRYIIKFNNGKRLTISNNRFSVN